MRLLPVSWAVTSPCMPSSNLVHLVQRVTVGAEFVQGRRVEPTSCTIVGAQCQWFKTMRWSKPWQVRLDSAN